MKSRLEIKDDRFYYQPQSHWNHCFVSIEENSVCLFTISIFLLDSAKAQSLKLALHIYYRGRNYKGTIERKFGELTCNIDFKNIRLCSNKTKNPFTKQSLYFQETQSTCNITPPRDI